MTLDKHRIPGSVDKHLPDFRGDSVTSDSVTTDDATINHGLTRGRNGERIDASTYDDATPKDRLNSALSDAVTGDVVYLENADYGSVTVSIDGIVLIGTAGISGLGGTEFQGATITGAECLLMFINGSNNTFNVDADSGTISHCTYMDINISNDRAAVLNCRDVAVTYESGTSGGLVDSCYGGSTVTDNGTNTVGDVI